MNEHADRDHGEVHRLEEFVELLPPQVGHNRRHFRAAMLGHMTSDDCPCRPERILHSGEPVAGPAQLTIRLADEPGTSQPAAARATPAQVEAAASLLGCESKGDVCDSLIHHPGKLTPRGCAWATSVADAVVAAGGAASSATGGSCRDDAEGHVPTDGERRARYAEAIRSAIDEARAVMAVADAEQAELRAEVERWRDKAQEAGAAYGLANSRHHAELDRANRLERMTDTLAGQAVDLEDRARAAEAKVARVRSLMAHLHTDLVHISDLRAALAGPEPEATEGGDDRG